MATWTPSDLISNQCYLCSRWRPKTKSQCEFYKSISQKAAFDYQDIVFLCDTGCKYYDERAAGNDS